MSSEEDKLKDSLRKLVESKEFSFDEADWLKMREMTEEEQLKDSLSQLVESKEFVFEEADWKQAEKLIHPEERRRRPVLWWSMAALLLITTGITTYYYITPSHRVADNNTPIDQHRTPAMNTVPAENAGTATSSSTEATAKKISDKNPSEEPAVKPTHQTPAGSFSSPTQNTSIASAKKDHATTLPSNAIAKQQAKAVTAAPQANMPEPTVEATRATGKESTVRTNAAGTSDPAPFAKTSGATKPDQTLAGAASSAGQTQQPESKAANVTSPAHGVVSTKSENTTPENILTENALQQPEYETVYLPTLLPVRIASPEQQLINAPAHDTPLPSPQKKMVMSFEAGTTWLAGWNNPGSTDAQGFNPVVGFNYYNYLTDKLSVSFGAQYTAVNHLSYSTYTSKTTFYNLGEESNVRVFTPGKMHYLMVPVKANYNINRNNTIGLGCNFGYLLAVDGTEETYTERMNRHENVKTSKTSGYNEGFASFDTQLSVFYRRKIYRNLSLNAELVYGITDIKNNTFFNSKVSEHNKGVKLTLVYSIFK